MIVRSVTFVTLLLVTNVSLEWLLIIPNIPSEPSRYRVAVWRELRRMGAVPVASGAWTVPDMPAFADGLASARAAAERGGGTVAVYAATPKHEADIAALADAFVAARRDEWLEFLADAKKFDAEIEREISKEKFTFGELEEEEQSLDRLRRWHRDLLKRNALPLPESSLAEVALGKNTASLEMFAQLVYAANLPANE